MDIKERGEFYEGLVLHQLGLRHSLSPRTRPGTLQRREPDVLERDVELVVTENCV